MKYEDQLKDSRWRIFAEKVKEKANWKCEKCGSINKTLHAHHKQYVNGRLAWQYNVELMECLCEECHNKIHYKESPEEKKCSRCGEDVFRDNDLCNGCLFHEDMKLQDEHNVILWVRTKKLSKQASISLAKLLMKKCDEIAYREGMKEVAEGKTFSAENVRKELGL